VTSFLQRLSLRDFRNFAQLDLTFPAAGVAIIGDNGSGKTNLLEAIYYLEIFRSFRGANDDQLVRFAADVFHVRNGQLTAAYEARTHRKRVTVDGAEPERISDAIGSLGAVIFSPSDVSIISGGPNERRRFLDIVLSVNQPGHLQLLQRYRQHLKQRNAVLKSGRADLAELSAWDAGLIENGAQIIVERANWVARHANSFADKYRTISGGTPGCLRYKPGVRALSDFSEVDVVKQAFEAELSRTLSRDRERGLTHAGPHRDDLAFMFGDNTDLRSFGSGGQVRTAAITLRMIEAETIHAARGRDCLVLLDDVFAQLDAARSQRILELLESEEKGQVILTAPKESDVHVRGGHLETWRISAGQLTT